jgi:hypothetical protein
VVGAGTRGGALHEAVAGPDFVCRVAGNRAAIESAVERKMQAGRYRPDRSILIGAADL